MKISRMALFAAVVGGLLPTLTEAYTWEARLGLRAALGGRR